MRAQLDLQGHCLIQVGALLLLLTCLEGLVIPYFPVPLLGRSVHTLAGMSGVVLIAFGLVWPRFRLSRAAAAMAFGRSSTRPSRRSACSFLQHSGALGRRLSRSRRRASAAPTCMKPF